MSIAAGLAYEAQLEELMRLAVRREELRPAVALRVSDSTIVEWEKPVEPDEHFQEMVQHLRHRVAQEMAVPAHMITTTQTTAQELYQREQQQMMRIYLSQQLSTEELIDVMGLGQPKAPVEVAPPTPPVKKYGRMLEP